MRGKDASKREVMPRGKSWDLGKALQLRLVNKLPYSQISKLLDVPIPTIANGLRPLIKMIDNPALIQAYRESEAELLDSVRLNAMQAIQEQLTDKKRRKKIDLMRLTNLFGVAFDKQRLIRGETTQNFAISRMIGDAHKQAIDVTEESKQAEQESTIA